MSSALEGVRVLELGHSVAGAMCAMLLGDFGAEVAKVSTPRRLDEDAAPGEAVWDRNKRRVVLDELGNGAGALRGLLLGADICIISSPSHLELLHEGRSGVPTARPSPIVVDVSPSSDSTPWAGGAESAELLGAHSGLALRQYSHNGGPVDLVAPHLLYVQGIWAAACASAALLERRRSGLGQRVTIDGLRGAMVSAPAAFVLDPLEVAPEPPSGPGGRNPFYSRYRCSDGAWIFLAALTSRFQERAVELLGIHEVAADPRLGGDLANALAVSNRSWVREAIGAAFLGRTRREWVRLLEDGGCPVGELAARDGWLDHPQLEAIGMRVEVQDPDRGKVVMPGLPLVLDASPGSIRSAAPSLKERAALDWPPRPAPEGCTIAEEGPLFGVRVVDLGTILAGPLAGSLLADLGAEVVKVEPPSGDPFRHFGFVYNREMRSLAIDLRDATARAALLEVIARADVVIDNYRHGVLEQFGLRRNDLIGLRPDLITFSITGFGDRGPLAAKLGFDPVLQAMSGMMVAQGGDAEPVYLYMPVNDVATAPLVVLGACIALLHRSRTGEGQRGWTSLAGLSAMMQSGELVRFAGREPARLGGRDYEGPSALDRYYRVADGWVRLQAAPAHLGALASALSLDAAVLAQDSSATDALRAALSDRTRAELLGALRTAGVPAAAARTIGDLTSDPALLDAQLLEECAREGAPPYFLPDRYARFSRTERRYRLCSPGLGEHSCEVLREAGVDEATIEGLLSEGFVVQGGPLTYSGSASYK